MDLETIRDIENEYMKNLVDEFMKEIKIENPYYSSTVHIKLETMLEFYEWFKNREEK